MNKSSKQHIGKWVILAFYRWENWSLVMLHPTQGHRSHKHGTQATLPGLWRPCLFHCYKLSLEKVACLLSLSHFEHIYAASHERFWERKIQNCCQRSTWMPFFLGQSLTYAFLECWTANPSSLPSHDGQEVNLSISGSQLIPHHLIILTFRALFSIFPHSRIKHKLFDRIKDWIRYKVQKISHFSKSEVP